MKTIVISVVCYNNEAEIISFLRQLSKQKLEDRMVALITVNSANHLELLQDGLRQLQYDYRLYNIGENLGYLHGCLYAIEAFSKEEKIDYAFITNTDIDILQENFIEIITKDFCDGSVWCVAPNVRRGSNGAKQNPFMLHPISKKKMKFFTIIYSSLGLFNLYHFLSIMKRKLYKQEVQDISSGYIYAADGSCFALHIDCVKKLLSNQDRIFMYGEELLVAGIIKENNKRIYYEETAHCVHNENGSTSLIQNRKKQVWFKNSFNYLYHRFFP